MKINWGTSTDKALNLPIILAIILLATASAAVADEGFYLYKPAKTQSQKIPAPGEGVLTRTITVQKGDTLKKLSHRYNGRSSFFPQILLFNRIENPDLIYAGKTLRVPLTRQEAPAAKGVKSGSEAERKKPAAREPARAKVKKRASSPRPEFGSSAGRLFDRGVTAFVKGRYREAIAIFDRYLAAYPHSADAPEAALYRADCYMKLSGR